MLKHPEWSLDPVAPDTLLDQVIALIEDGYVGFVPPLRVGPFHLEAHRAPTGDLILELALTESSGERGPTASCTITSLPDDHDSGNKRWFRNLVQAGVEKLVSRPAMTPSQLFDAMLIAAGTRPGGGGLRWRAFMSRERVVAELDRLGYELVEDGADHDPRLRRFFAAPKSMPASTD